MNPQLTPDQQREWENAVKIGNIIADSVNSADSPPVRVNPHTLKEAVGIYNTLGARKPFLQGSEQFVMNCLAYNGEIFAACSQRIVLCYYRGLNDLVYWYGNGKVKEQEPLDTVRQFFGINRLLIATLLINETIFQRLQQHLASQQ